MPQIKLAKGFKGSVSCVPIRSTSGKPVVLKVLKGANVGGAGSGPKVVMLKGAMLKKNATEARCSNYSLSQRKKVKCTWCKKIMFQNKYDFHKKRRHLWGEFRCPVCGAEAFFAKDLVEHIKHHENIKEEIQETSADCPICKKKYQIEVIEAHHKSCAAEKVKDVICDFCSKPVPVQNEKMHNMKRHRFYGLFECPTCRIEADSAEDIVAHVRSTGHGGDGLVRCPLCKGAFPFREIDKHCEDCVGRKRMVICSQCGKELTTMEGLRLHTKYMHPADGVLEEHPCDRCGQVFKSKDHLRSHVKIVHEGKNRVPIPCSVCNKVLPKSQMQTHQRKEHGIGNEQLQCSECGHISQTKGLYNTHMKCHKERQFQCSFCEKKLKSRANLITHERQHTGEKPFSCQICSAVFASRSALGQHMRGVHKIAKRGGHLGWYRKQKKATDGIDECLTVYTSDGKWCNPQS